MGVGGVDSGQFVSVCHSEAARVGSAQISGGGLTKQQGGISRLPVVKRLLQGGPDGRGERCAGVWLELGRGDVRKGRQSRYGCLRYKGQFLRILQRLLEAVKQRDVV